MGVGGDTARRSCRRGDDEDDDEEENGWFGLEKAERDGLKQKAIAIVVDLALGLSLSV